MFADSPKASPIDFSATAPQRHSATAPQRHSATAPQRHSASAETTSFSKFRLPENATGFFICSASRLIGGSKCTSVG